MNWFASSPVDAEIEKATNEKNTTEQWDAIMAVCDKIKTTGCAKDSLKVIMKKLVHVDPHVVVQAITLLDACVNNCGKAFHLEIASREFENYFKLLLTKHEAAITTKLKLILKKWAEGDFKDDPQLDLIPSLYKQLKSEGHDFTDHTQMKSQVTYSKDPNVVSSQQEEEDIAKAIELSLKEVKGSPKTVKMSNSIYPSMSNIGSTPTPSTNTVEPRKVRALYDFEAAEDNELTFVAGEIIHVTDDSDQNWWKGYNKRGEGLFPSNFVTADLSVEPESIRTDVVNMKKTEEHKQEQNFIQLEIDESKIDRLFHLLNEANPEDPSTDTDEMLTLEQQVNQMGPLIDAELERVDRKHAQLTQLSSELVDAINLYHTLMRESDRPMSSLPYMGYMSQPPSMYGMYQNMPPNMFIPPTGGMNFPPVGMMHPPNMPMPHHIPPNSIPAFANQNQSRQLEQVPSQLQNGHMVLPNLPNQNSMPNQTATVQQPIVSNVPQSGQTIQNALVSNPHTQNIHNIPHNPNIIAPSLVGQTSAPQNPNFVPHEQQQQQQQPSQQHSQPQHTNITGPPNMQHIQHPPHPTNDIQNQSIQMRIPSLPPPQVNPMMSLQRGHIIQHINVNQTEPSPHLNSTPMQYGSIQTTILPSADNKNNIPVYQQQR